MALSIETIYEVCLPLHNAGNKVSCKQVRPFNHFCDVTIPLKFTANQIDRIDVYPSAVRQGMTRVYLSFLLYSSPVSNVCIKRGNLCIGTKVELKEIVVLFAGSRVWGSTSGLPGTMNCL